MTELRVDMVCQDHEVMWKRMLMRHLASWFLCLEELLWGGGVSVEITIVRSVDRVGHSSFSGISQS